MFRTISVASSCESCSNFYMCDHECSCGHYLESDKIVVECDEYAIGEPKTSLFDELEKENS